MLSYPWGAKGVVCASRRQNEVIIGQFKLLRCSIRLLVKSRCTLALLGVEVYLLDASFDIAYVSGLVADWCFHNTASCQHGMSRTMGIARHDGYKYANLKS